MKNIKYVLLILPFICLTSCSSFGTKNLKDVYKDYFTIGAAFNEYNFDSGLEKHFNSLTVENAMKWISVHPNLNGYNFTTADTYIAFAKKHKLNVRGHALVWHHEQSIPAEIFTYDKETILDIERDHVKTVVTHFKDDVYCWDVCNEVIDDGTAELAEDGSNIYRQSNWYKACGRDFIKEAYVEADKTLKELGIRDKVKLYYNDYDNTKKIKKDKTIAMLNWLIEENVPIDGIGLQCHYHLGSFDLDALEQSIIEYSSLGLDVQITEFDCNIYDESLADKTINYETYEDVPAESLKLQATIYGRAFEVFRKHADKISNVTFWGISDDVTYMNDNPDFGYRTNYPYIFDVFHEKKPAYYLITDFEG